MTKARTVPPSRAPRTNGAAPSVDNPGPDVAPHIAAGAADPATARQRDEELENAAIFETLRAEGMAEGTVSLSRRALGETSFGHLGILPVPDYSIETVKTLYGGGEYRAQARNSQQQFVKGWTFKIDLRIPSKHPDAPAAKPENDVAAIVQQVAAAVRGSVPAPAGNGDLTAVLSMFSAQLIAAQKANADLVSAMMQRAAAPAVDPALATILSEMRREISEIKSGGRQRNNLRETLEDLRALDELRGEKDDGEKPASFAENLGKGLASAAPLLLEMFTGAGAGARQQAEQAPALPHSTAAAPAPDSPQPPTDPEPAPAMDMATRVLVGRFKSAAVDAARKARDPRQFVDGLFAMAPESAHGKIYSLANSSTWFAAIFGGDGEAAKFVDWLKSMRGEVLLRAFVSYARTYSTQNKPAAECAQNAIAQLDAGFHDDLFNATEPEAWRELFTGETIPAEWLESLRLAVEKELGDDEETARADAPAAKP